MENTSVFAKYDPGRARYVRVRARMNGSSNDVYSNAIRIETYYPITINTGEYEDLWAMTESRQTCRGLSVKTVRIMIRRLPST